MFGDFYSHELSFCLINKNDYKNLINIFNKCNLRVKKLFIKSFVEGAYTSQKNNSGTFFQIQLNDFNSKIFYFENNSLKFEQDFDFGLNMIVQDIAKITSIKYETIKQIIINNTWDKEISDQEYLEKIYFENSNFRKIKKKLINEIAVARIKEIFEILIYKNINFQSFDNVKMIFLNVNNQDHFKCFKETYRSIYSQHNLKVKFLDNISTSDFLNHTYKLVHFGWNKEVIPVAKLKKSLIARFFDMIFG